MFCSLNIVAIINTAFEFLSYHELWYSVDAYQHQEHIKYGRADLGLRVNFGTSHISSFSELQLGSIFYYY